MRSFSSPPILLHPQSETKGMGCANWYTSPDLVSAPAFDQLFSFSCRELFRYDVGRVLRAQQRESLS